MQWLLFETSRLSTSIFRYQSGIFRSRNRAPIRTFCSDSVGIALRNRTRGRSAIADILVTCRRKVSVLAGPDRLAPLELLHPQALKAAVDVRVVLGAGVEA